MIDFRAAYLERYSHLNTDAFRAAVSDSEKLFKDKRSEKFLSLYRNRLNRRAAAVDTGRDEVMIGTEDELTSAEHEQLVEELQAFIPWRKGPFNLFSHQIDAEWRSDYKWNRFEPYIGSLKDKRICDIGCNNGYFMFRMASHAPELVIGFDPVPRFKLMFEYLNSFAGFENLKFEMLGFEALDLLPGFFDVAFQMGIVYHHPDPVGVLKKTYSCLKPGGLLVLESMGIGGREPYVLFPEKKYTGARGMWFLPTETVLLEWLRRAGFTDTDVILNMRLETGEQRATVWAPFKSLADGLSSEDENLTIEGYERPHRIYITARK